LWQTIDPPSGSASSGLHDRPSGEKAREGTRVVLDGVGRDRKAEIGEASRIAVGVEHEAADLWSQPRGDGRQHGSIMEDKQALVGGRACAGEHP